MDTPMPLFTVVDNVIRMGLILFLAFYAFKFKCWLMFIVLGISSATLYAVFFRGADPEGTVITLLGQLTAFVLVYMLYEFMRMRHAIRSLPSAQELDDTKQGAMDVASNKKSNQPNTRDQQLATRSPSNEQ